MMAMDSLQREVRSHFGKLGFDDVRSTGVTDAFGDSGAGLRRPGYRIGPARQAARRAINDAYAQYESEQASAWMNNPPTGFDSRGPRGAQPRDTCVIDGRAGHLREIDGKLVCIADNSILGEDHALNDRELAHAEHRHYLENAWRSPDRSVQVPDRGSVRGSDHAMTDREAAYADYQSRIENAWRDGR